MIQWYSKPEFFPFKIQYRFRSCFEPKEEEYDCQRTRLLQENTTDPVEYFET
jgi:hypothetical protein